jgi:peroxiredoxin
MITRMAMKFPSNTAPHTANFVAFMITALYAKEDKSMLKVGDTAKDFTLASHTGDTITLSSFRGKSNVVLIFYPGDETPR